MILSSNFYLRKLKYNKDSIIAWSGRFTFPCMSLRLFSLLYEYLISPVIKRCNNNIELLKLLFIFSLTLRLSLIRYRQ